MIACEGGATTTPQVAEWREYGKDDERHRRLMEAARRELEKICYRWFGLSADAIRVPPASSVSNAAPAHAPAAVHRDALDRELAVRVYGDTVIQHVPVVNPERPPTGPTSSWPEATAAPTPA